jgi:hypothetical protein
MKAVILLKYCFRLHCYLTSWLELENGVGNDWVLLNDDSEG